MKKIFFIWNKVLKKLRSSAIKDSKIHKTSKIESGSNIMNLIMDKHSFCGYNCEIYNAKIGSFCSIANGVTIGGGMHPLDWVSTSPAFYEGRDSIKAKFSEHKRISVKTTIIGHDVWIGQNAIIKQGVKIGTGAVVAMGSVVTTDIPEYAIVGGIPAKIIRNRFSDDVIKKILNTKWWNFDDKKLKKCAINIMNPNKFLDSLNK